MQHRQRKPVQTGGQDKHLAHSMDWTIGQFKEYMRTNWAQGEHVALCGPTGSGKTTVACDIVVLRDYAVMLAVKRYDDTINLFKKAGFKVINKWPPDYTKKHVILWSKPDSLDSATKQTAVISEALERIYISGGWCVYFDEAGFIAGHLRLGGYLGVLLNQGRSSHISVVCAMTRPHSMVARIPAETLNQCRHILIFKYTDEREIKACAEICGLSFHAMQQLQQALDTHDFLYVGKRNVAIVRNTRG